MLVLRSRFEDIEPYLVYIVLGVKALKDQIINTIWSLIYIKIIMKLTFDAFALIYCYSTFD